MIPKTIHYCWFGRGEKPALARRCIASWRAFCPDYEIIEWNEDKFDVNSNRYTREAYGQKKYAFVTDYVRLYALYHYGGIYMDTDVEVIRPLDEFLTNRAFSGFESTKYVPTGIMASEKELPIIHKLLCDYDERRFLNEDGSVEDKTNCVYITNTMKEFGLVLDGNKQTIKDFTFYPPEYFCPFLNETGVLNKTRNTATIHWFSKSWLPLPIRLRARITRVFHRFFGIDCFRWLKR